jgi:hypothetical protein
MIEIEFKIFITEAKKLLKNQNPKIISRSIFLRSTLTFCLADYALQAEA